MNSNLFKTILAMDSYNRGYDAGIKFTEPNESLGQRVGNFTISTQSSVVETSQEVKAGFYGLAYQEKDALGNVTNTIVSYRGTDQMPHADQAIGLSDLSQLFSFPGFGAINIAVKLANNIAGVITPDTWDGWFVGAGYETRAQALLAFEFYKEVVGGFNNVYSANVSLTGHSLGGGLAGYVGANDNYQVTKSQVA